MNIKTMTTYVVRNDNLDQYLKEISKFKILTAQEERDLFVVIEDCNIREKELQDILMTFKNDGNMDRYRKELEDVRAKRDETMQYIVDCNLRLNFAIAKRYSTGDILPDLIDTGVMGMYEAFKDYDWRKGVRWTTYAQYYIRRAIVAYLGKENILVRPKNGMHIAPKVRKIENDFLLKNGRRPYPIEVIDILRRDYGIDVKDEIDIYGQRFDSIDDYIGEEEENTFEKSGYFNEKTSVENEYERTAEKDAATETVKEMMKVLTERERNIISMAFGYGYTREYKDREIGNVIGLTSERVRQIKKEAIKKMRAAAVAAENK